MTPIPLMFLLFAAGIVLLIGELLLPTHGVLGICGGICIAAMIVVCFRFNQWLGLAFFLMAILTAPFLFNLSMQLWARSPVGRKMILQPVNVGKAPSAIKLGQTGVAVTEMRPMGECDFGDMRLEAISELGLIQPGQPVKVVAVDNGRPTVRVILPQNQSVT